MSAPCYRSIAEKALPFYYFACCLVRHKIEIDTLKDTVEHLKGKIASLKSSQSLQTSQQSQAPQLMSSVPKDLASVVSTSVNASSTPAISPPENHERKFNVVVHGIEECPRGTSRVLRFKGDMEKVVSSLSDLDNSIGYQSIKDVYHLGKFSSDKKKPRPLLVKFIRAADVSTVLSKRRSLRNSLVSIKPDMSPLEQKCESLLLKERWSLIQSGVPRPAIRIRGSRLLVRNKLHGQIRLSGSTPYYSASSESHNSDVLNSSPFVQTQPITVPCSQTDSSPIVPSNISDASETPQNIQTSSTLPSTSESVSEQ